EVAPPQRQRLRPELPRAVRPAEHAEHHDESEEAGVLLVGGDHDDEREDRQNKDDVGDERKEPVGASAEVSRRDADEDREARGECADRQRYHEREPRSPDDLREDVLPVGGRAEQVVPGRGERGLEDLRLSVVGRDLAREDREHDEEEHHQDADERFPVATDGTPDVTPAAVPDLREDRKSTRLNSSHVEISYAVFCLKKKNYNQSTTQVSRVAATNRPGFRSHD